tara:strand:+ start:390 stop:3590 length:3201 start_codon:yes stop_codon:yes gene_type:complete
MSTLNFINSSALRGDASLISNSKLLLQSSGNTTATQSFIFNDGAASKLALGIGDPATSSNIKFFIDSAGDINISSNVGIGTAPQTNDDLAVKGNVHVISGLRDGSSSLGSNNYVLTSTGSATAWVDASSSSIIGGPYVEIAGDTMTGPLIIEDALSNPNPLLTLYNTTSGDYSTIEFSDQAPTVLQKGYLKFSHLDSQSFGGGASFHFNSTEDDLVLAVGDADATHGRVAVWSGGSSAEADYCFAQDVNTGMRRLGTDNVGLIGGGVTGVSVTGTASSMRYAGATKIATTSTGVSITGNTIGSIGATFSGGTGTGVTVLNIGSSSQTNFTKQDWINDTHGSSQAYILAYGSTNAQAGNFAMKNLETGGEIFFELASSSEPLRLTSTHITLGSYGSGSVTGTVANLLAVDSSGKVIETTASGSGAVTGSGTAEYIPKWNSTTALVNSKMFQSTVSSQTFLNVGGTSGTGRMGLLVVPEQTNTISGYDFGLQLNNNSTFNVGGQSKVYTSIYEGIKILPGSGHYLTRITPRLEVYPFEDPSTTTDNTYDSSFTGSSFSMGSSNTIGSSGSSNLGIFGFNNKIKGDKFVIIGQGNEMDLDDNVSSLVVGTTNDATQGGLANSLLVGQNINVQRKVTRGIISGINHGFVQDSNNCLVAGSGNGIYGNNNVIWGANNQGLSGVNNIMQGGFSTQVTGNSGNFYGTVLVGWNNTLRSCDASLITGRDNVVDRVDYSIIAGFNNDVGNGGSNYGSNLVVGRNGQINGNNNIAGGDNNTCSQSQNIIGGTSNNVSANDNLVVGTSNTVRIDECIVGGNSNTIGDTSDTGDARILAMGQSNSASNTSNTLLLGAGNTSGNNIGAPTNVTNAATFGQNNTLATAGNAPDNNFLLFSMGRANNTSGTLAFAFGGGNTVRSNTSGNCIAIGNSNTLGWTTSTTAARNSIIIGTQNALTNSVQNNRNDYKILIGRGLDEVGTAGADYVLIGRNNDQNNDYSILNMSCSLIVGASTMGSASDRRNAIVVQNKTGASEEPNVILPSVGKYRNYANDSAAATGGVPLYGIYHTNGDLKIRVT